MGREGDLTVGLTALAIFDVSVEDLMVDLVTASLGLRDRVTVVLTAGDRILAADAAVGFVKSVVNLRLGFSTGAGAGAPTLERAREAAVGAYK